jgi:hypothetical protein
MSSVVVEDFDNSIAYNSQELLTTKSDIENKVLQSGILKKIVEQDQKQKTVIFSTSKSSKMKLIQLIEQHKGLVINNLPYLPFIIAQVPNNEINIIKQLGFNSYIDKPFQAIPESWNLEKVNSISQNEVYISPSEQMNALPLTENGLTGEGIKLAILDSGIDSSHKDLEVDKDNAISFVTTAYEFSYNESVDDENGHGSHVAGIAAGKGKSNSNYAGVSPDATLYNFKVASRQGHATLAALLGGINAAIDANVDIISISLGMSTRGDPDHPSSIALDTAVREYGIHVVVSAGNSGPSKGTVKSPGSSRSVITVGAGNQSHLTASFSSRGPRLDSAFDPDLIAPGARIIAPLARESITEESQKYYSPSAVIPGGSSGHNYIGYSGTSMASPAAAGAIALLLSNHSITPFGMRAALMESADDTSEPEYVQGAGFLNIGKADELISKNLVSETSPEVNILSILPKNQIFSDSPILTPLDQIQTRLQLVSGFDSNIDLNIVNEDDSINNTLLDIFSLDRSSFSMNSTGKPGSYYDEVVIKGQIPINPTPGYYKGALRVNWDSTNELKIPIGPIVVKVPQRSISWEMWGNDGADSPNSNYAELKTYLMNNNTHLMVNDEPLSSFTINQSRTIILADIEASMSSQQFELLETHIENGGNIVILGSFFPFTNYENLNQLTMRFGVKFLDVQDLEILDIGLTQYTYNAQGTVSLISDNHLDFSSINSLEWRGGTHLSVSSPAKVLGKLEADDVPVLAGFFGNSTFPGKLIVASSEYWFYSDYFGSEEQKLANIIFNYLEPTNKSFLTLIPEASETKFGQSWSAAIFIGENNLWDNSSENLDIRIDNQQINPINLIGKPGFLVNLTSLSVGRHTLKVQYKNNNINYEFLVYENVLEVEFFINPLNTTKPNFIPSYLEDTEPLVVVENGNAIVLEVNTNSSLSNKPFALISLVPEVLSDYTDFYQNIPLNNQKKILIEQGTTGKTWEAEILIDDSYVSGNYFIEIFVDSTDFSVSGNTTGDFFVIYEDPLIDISQSEINNDNFDEYEEQSTSDQFFSINPGDSITFSVIPETISNQTEAFVMFIPWYPFIESRTFIDFISLDYIPSKNSHIGSMTLFNNNSLVMDNGQTLNFGNPRILAFFVILRDTNGNWDYFVIIATMQDSLFNFGFDQSLIFLIFIGLPAALFLFVYIRSRKRQSKFRDYDIYSRYAQNRPRQPQPDQRSSSNLSKLPQKHTQYEIRFCPSCGAEFLPGMNFCDECGKRIKIPQQSNDYNDSNI